MERISRVVGPAATNVHVLADERTREAIAIDTAIPSLAWIARRAGRPRLDPQADRLDPRPLGSHRRQRGRARARPAPRSRSTRSTARRSSTPQPLWAPFEIPPSVPAVELAEGGEIRFGEIRLRVLHTPGHTPGSVCLQSIDDGLLFSGDTLFAGGWGRIDLPGGSGRGDRRRRSLRLRSWSRRSRSCRATARRRRSAASVPWLELVRATGRLPA